MPKEHAASGDLVAIDGSLIDAVLSMAWADYRQGAKKAKVHVGFDLNHSIPPCVYQPSEYRLGAKDPERIFLGYQSFLEFRFF